MADETTDHADRDRRIGQVLAAYDAARDAGQAPDRAALLRQHPDLAEDLAAYFARHDRLEHLVEPLRPIAPASPPDTQADAGATADHRAPRTGPSEPPRPGTEETLAASSPGEGPPGTDGGDGDGDDDGA